MPALLGKLLLLSLLFPITLLGPGALALRRSRWGAPERFTASLALSVLFLYLAAFLGYVLSTPPALWAWSTVAACAAMATIARNDIAWMLRSPRVRQFVLAYAVLSLWCLLLLLVTRHYAGGMWSGDWIAHFEKAQIFAHRVHPDPNRAALILLERPPAMNLVASLYLSIAGGFESFQFICLLLNALVIVPTLWIARELVPGGLRRHAAPAIVLLMACPMFVESTTYTWTKHLSAFYATLGTGLYLSATRRRDPRRLAVSTLCFAGGMLIHYLAFSYAAFCALHYLFTGWRRQPRPARATLLAALTPAAVALPWVAWVLLTYGWHTWKRAGDILRGTMHYTPYQQFIYIGHNVINTFVPFPLRISSSVLEQPNPVGLARDTFFLLYQSEALPALGSAGAIITLYLLATRLRLPKTPRERRTQLILMLLVAAAALVLSLQWPVSRLVFEWFPSHLLLALGVAATALVVGAAYAVIVCWNRDPSWQRWFWRGWLVVAPLGGIPMTVSRQDHGMAHMFMNPAVFMALALVAASLPQLPRWVRWALAAGVTVDFTLGILLHFWLQGLTFGPKDSNGTVTDTHGLLKQAVLNWQDKEFAHLHYLGDYFAPARPALLSIALAVFIASVVFGLIRVPHSGHRSADALRS